jgi:hypothetical protein
MTIAKIGLFAIASLMAVTETVPLPEPLVEISKYGTLGMALGLVWWIIAKTLPAMTSEVRQDMAKRIEKHDENNREQIKVLQGALKEVTEYVAALKDRDNEVIRRSWQQGDDFSRGTEPHPPKRTTHHRGDRQDE